MDIWAKALTIPYNGISHKIITEIVVCNWETKKCLKTSALRDTGATICAIDGKVAKDMGLIPISKTPIGGVHWKQDANVYVVDIQLPNAVWITKLQVVECNTDSWFIIWMNVICLGDFCVSNFNNKTTMTFVFPSQRKTDFVSEWNQKHKKVVSPTMIHQWQVHKKRKKR